MSAFLDYLERGFIDALGPACLARARAGAMPRDCNAVTHFLRHSGL